jgi:hypothetical protein
MFVFGLRHHSLDTSQFKPILKQTAIAPPNVEFAVSISAYADFVEAEPVFFDVQNPEFCRRRMSEDGDSIRHCRVQKPHCEGKNTGAKRRPCALVQRVFPERESSGE